ncbi:MAG: PKD repeat protein [Bacteroidia bacterium]|jgi:PKD repeat protein
MWSRFRSIEFTIDHNASNLVFTGSKECGGYEEAIKFTFNNGANIDLEDAKVYYTINKGTAAEVRVDETIDTVKASSSADYTFDAIPVFHEPGVNTIEVGLACDDNTSNNILTTTITITPAPHSFELSEGTNFPGYYNAGSLGNPDVTVPGKKIEYDVENPTKYGNSAYGTDWSAVIVAMTEGGTDASGDANLTNPGTAKGILDFDPSASLADSMVWLGLTVTDNNTGCDSTFGRWVYVPHTPAVDWIGADGCDGEVVAFVNKSTQPTGATEYSWDFGDPNSGAEYNTSTISDPIHRFSTYGSYTVKMTAWNFDYPKFTYTKTGTVSISPVPTVAYRVNNACFGDAITFVNMTTLPSGITGTIDYTWNFGNGTTSKKKDESYKYPAPGGYKVTLTASLKGCAASLTKNANQFAKPIADFSVAGKCNLEEIEFMNASTIAIGNTGYNWSFNDGSVSNLTNPTHAFATPGAHTVKLKAVSEFGCTDETERTFTLNESPKADFSYTDACSETAVEFTREGSLPSGANSIFEWDFDEEKISTKENDNHKFSTVGVKNVSLKVSSDNGCSDMISKEFVVKLQAKADFVANNVCVGEDVVFTNNSDVAAGNLDYEWRFGGANAAGMSTSSNTSPRHNYVLGDEGVTESFRVTLLALVPGGCSDSIAKTVTVNAKSDASFTASVNWRTLTVTPATTDGNANQFNWTFGDGGRSNDVAPTYQYSVDQDEFEVCLAIINNAGCISKHCEPVKVDLARSSVNDIAANGVFNVYPNPNTGIFNVKVLDPQNDLNIVIMDATGKTIKTVNTDASGVYNVDMTDVAAGVYMVQVINGKTSAMQRVTIAN